MRQLNLFALLIGWALIGCSAPAIPTPIPDNAVTAETPAYNYPDNVTVFNVVPVDSKVQYVVRETFLENVSAIINFDPSPGDVTTIGTTRAVTGHIALDLRDGFAVAGGDFSVDLLTLRTNQDRRDERIRSNWLESYRYPTATFTITDADFGNVEADGSTRFTLFGDLTVRDKTRPIELKGSGELDGKRLTASASSALLMSDFGVMPPQMDGIVSVEDAFELRVVVTAVNR